MSARKRQQPQPKPQPQQPQQDAHPAQDAAETTAAPLIAECQQIAQQLADYGVAVNFGGVLNLGDLKPGIEASAAGVVLVMKGVCTADEWSDIVHLTLRETLAKVLQAVEEARLKERTALAVPAPRPLERPKLAIARQ